MEGTKVPGKCKSLINARYFCYDNKYSYLSLCKYCYNMSTFCAQVL